MNQAKDNSHNTINVTRPTSTAISGEGTATVRHNRTTSMPRKPTYLRYGRGWVHLRQGPRGGRQRERNKSWTASLCEGYAYGIFALIQNRSSFLLGDSVLSVSHRWHLSRAGSADSPRPWSKSAGVQGVLRSLQHDSCGPPALRVKGGAGEDDAATERAAEARQRWG